MIGPDQNRTIKILFDGQCPLCSAYVRHLRLKENYGVIELVNARENLEMARWFASEGKSLDDGMIVQIDEIEFYGADAVHALAMLSSSSGMLNRLNAVIFRSQRVSKFLYPLMKAGRALLLRAMGRTKINESLRR